ncbi:MAG: Hpt domain-containing protein [Microcoleaceae cyanobacterium]
MPTDQDQYRKIFGIFMEEAQEHLDTLETGLKHLPAIMADSDRERITAMYRAAHSLKGGSAMLMKDVPSLSSINKVSKRLEDCFKSVKDTPIKVDSTAQTLSNKGYEVIKNLIHRCQSASGLSPQMGEKIATASLPLYEKLEKHLANLMKATPATGKATTAAVPGASATVMKVLKPMLQLFKKPPSTASRQQLLKLTLHLAKMGSDIEPWQNFVKTIQAAIKNPQASYKELANTIVKELQQAGKLLEAGKASAIAPSAALQQLASAAKPAGGEITIPADPKEVVKVLLKTFNKKQLQAIAQLLIRQIKS